MKRYEVIGPDGLLKTTILADSVTAISSNGMFEFKLTGEVVAFVPMHVNIVKVV